LRIGQRGEAQVRAELALDQGECLGELQVRRQV
jgi:hypothetical protein